MLFQQFQWDWHKPSWSGRQQHSKVPSSLQRSAWWGIASPLAKSGELLKWWHPSCSCCSVLPSLESCLSLESLSGGMEGPWHSGLLNYAVWPDTRQRSLHFSTEEIILIGGGKFQMLVRCSVFWKQDWSWENVACWVTCPMRKWEEKQSCTEVLDSYLNASNFTFPPLPKDSVTES